MFLSIISKKRRRRRGVSLNSWIQLGQDINGESSVDAYGEGVAMNASGNRIIVGAINNGEAGYLAGYARVHEFNNGSWVQLGQNLYVNADRNGRGVGMNAVGNRVAVGSYTGSSVRVYELNGNLWSQLGQTIQGEGGDRSGYSISLNSTGDRIIIGAPTRLNSNGESGSARIYTLIGNSWVQLGSDINGKFANDRFGEDVSINANGDRVAISTTSNYAQIYTLIGNSWIKLGSDIINNGADSIKIRLNSSGNRFIIGVLNGSTQFSNVYEWDGNYWVQLGDSIFTNTNTQTNTAPSVGINGSGDRIIISRAIDNNLRGRVRMYYWNNSSWIQAGLDVIGKNAGDMFGVAMAINESGDRIAVGATGNDSNGVGSGQAGVYQIL